MCDKAAKTLGSNPLKHIEQSRPGTVKKPAKVRAFSYVAATDFKTR
jgi:hypothetical protein